MKNNITRMLDSRGIPYKTHQLPAKKLSAGEAAELLQISPDLVYKTIVVTRLTKGKHILAVVPGPLEVDLKALAKALGEKKLKIATERKAEQITGLQAGGISPLALLNRGFQVVLDESATSCGEIYISGGQRGMNIRLPTQDLVSLTRAKTGKIAKKKIEKI